LQLIALDCLSPQVRLSLDEALTPTILSVDPSPELPLDRRFDPYRTAQQPPQPPQPLVQPSNMPSSSTSSPDALTKAAGGRPADQRARRRAAAAATLEAAWSADVGQPWWHANCMRRVASDVLNLTGAVQHPRRRELFRELRTQLQRAVTVRSLKGSSRKQQRELEQERLRRAKGMRGGKGAHTRSGAEGRRKRRGWFSQISGAFSWFMGSVSMGDSSEFECKMRLPLTTREEVDEPCLTAADVDQLTLADTEFLWRFGFRRIVPGAADEARRALRPLKPADMLLARYLARWPKDEEPMALPPWVHELAQRIEGEAAESEAGAGSLL
jgi:hypothetical protein